MTDLDSSKSLNKSDVSSHEQVSFFLNRIKSKLMFTRNKSAQFSTLEELDLQLRKYDGDHKRLLREAISSSDSSGLSFTMRHSFSLSLHIQAEL
ncbi:MAG: hypothetical protein PHR78_06315, partial [Eubacteriales bacterium]|nr:hypothetical protein [Eubacteriales bacterium]